MRSLLLPRNPVNIRMAVLLALGFQYAWFYPQDRFAKDEIYGRLRVCVK